MQLNSFLYHLVLLLIPGLLGLKISRSLSSVGTERKKIKEWYDVFIIIAYTFCASIVYDSMVIPIMKCLFNIDKEKTFAILTSTDKYFDVEQIVKLTVIDIIIGVLSAFIYNKKFLYKIGKCLKITKQYGEEDVWSYINNSKEMEWVYVRNYKNGLSYSGYIQLFSDSNEKREVLLGNVSVFFTDTAELLYEMENVYLSLDNHDISIEFYKKEE